MNALANHLEVFRVLSRQIGVVRALKVTCAKVVVRLLMPHAKPFYAQTGEDLMLRTLASQYLQAGTFTYLDIGCNDARHYSTSYSAYLAGSRGLVIDLNPSFANSFKRERPNDLFVCAAISDVRTQVVLYEFAINEVNTIDAEQALKWAGYWRSLGKRTIQSVTLVQLLLDNNIQLKFDVLMMDVEGHELQVLRGADLDSLAPKIIICEIHDLDIYELDKNPVVSYLHAHRYRLVSYATMNAYFVRADIFEHKVGQQQTSQSGNSA